MRIENDRTASSSRPAQDERRQRLLAGVITSIRPLVVQTDGLVKIDFGPHDGESRLTLWIIRALFATGVEANISLANDLIVGLTIDDPRYHFNSHFCGVAVAMLLLQHGDQLSVPAADRLRRYLNRYVSDWMTEDFVVHGANDNAAIECATSVILSGHLFERPALIDFGLNRLRRLDHLLDLRGYVHECVSPTYSAVSLSTLAELVEYAPNDDIRAIALRAEQRIWQEVLLHFHPSIGQMVGPFSRTFFDDNANQCSLIMMTLYSAMGEVSPFNPATMLFPPPDGTFSHKTWPFQWASLAAHACPTYHPPVELAERVLSGESPRSIAGSCEFLGMGAAPGGQSRVSCFMTEDWGLGSFGSRPLAGAAAHAIYRRHDVHPEANTLDKLAAIRSVYTRCQVSDRVANFFVRDGAQGETEEGSEHGAAFCAQERGTLLVGYVPVVNCHAVKTIKSSVLFPCHFSHPDEVWFEELETGSTSASFKHSGWSFVRDGDIYLGVLPLMSEQRTQMLCVQQHVTNGPYFSISAFNMSGFSGQEFSATELRRFGGGFAIEIASRSEVGSFETFRASCASATVVHRQWENQREIRYCRDGRDLELIYDCANLSLRRCVSMGKLQASTTRLETSPSFPLIG